MARFIVTGILVSSAFGAVQAARRRNQRVEYSTTDECQLHPEWCCPPPSMSKSFNTQNLNGDGRTATSGRILIPASTLPETAFPTVTIPDNRYAPLTEHGARRAKGSHGTIQNHERGILGEFAAADFFGVPNRVDTQVYEFGDPGYDFEIGGWRVDVKTANPRWQRPSLMVDAKKELTADFYVLVHQLAQQCYRVIGYASAAMVARAPTRQIGLHPAKEVRMVEQDRLIPLPTSVSGTFG